MLARQPDWQWVSNFDQYDAYVDHNQIQIVIRPTVNHRFLWINKNNSPLENTRVRQAIVLALDRQSGIDALLY